MAIFEKNAKAKPGSRSNTKLIISGGSSPAEHWIADPTLETLFTYDYGGPGQKDVVISKGMAVGIKPDPEMHWDLEVNKGVLTMASDDAPVIGIAPYNFARDNAHFLDGNQPSIITREFIELPLFGDAASAAEVKWGAVYNTPGQEIKNGDYVTYSRDKGANAGKLIKYSESAGHKPQDILGQVLASEIDQEPWGWLKWAMYDEAARREDQGADKAGYSGPGQDGFPYDAEYRDGVIDVDGYLSQYTTNPTGIPGILDGSQKAQTQKNAKDTVPAGYAAEKYTFNLGLKDIVDGTVAVYKGATLLSEATDYVVDYKVGRITINNATAGENYSVDFRAHYFGTPAGWDHKGAVGAVRILLQR